MAITEESVRARFPALGRGQIYMDNAGGSQTLDTVIDSIKDYLTSTNVQLGANYPVSKQSTDMYTAAYAAGAGYINAELSEVVYGPSTTELFRVLSFALKFAAGDEIILSAFDHEANIAPWVDMAERQGLEIKWWKPERTTDPRLLPADLEKIISKKTKFVACTHVSNILGTIHDIKAIAKITHDAGALLCVDAVAYAPHRAVDVKELGVDFYSFSWYKVYGPHLAILYGSSAAQQHMKSLGHYFNSHKTMADKLGLAATSYELAQTIRHIVEYLGPQGSETWKFISEQEERLQVALLEYLRSRPEVTIYGVESSDPTLRVPTISFVVKGWDSKAFVEEFESKTAYGFRWGAFYSNRLVIDGLDLGNSGVVRVSLVHYNTRKCILGSFLFVVRVIYDAC